MILSLVASFDGRLPTLAAFHLRLYDLLADCLHVFALPANPYFSF